MRVKPRFSTLCLVFLGLVFLGCGGGGGGGTGGECIVFASDHDGDFEICRIHPDGSGFQQLTNNSSDDYFPSISGDGDLITFESDRDGNTEIYIMNSNGTGQ